MNEIKFIKDYLKLYNTTLFGIDVSDQLKLLKSMLLDVKSKNKKVLIAGNGASAAIASHVSVDFTKQAGIRTVNFNEADLITCFANDYGYENWVTKALEFYMKPEDLVILISSSGNSKNLVNAAQYVRSTGNKIVTFTGFNKDNPLMRVGDLSFWVESKAYNIIENTHQIWLLLVCDMIIGKAEYSS